MKPPIFIVGCPRSGTSLLRNLLRSHPSFAFPGESHFIPRLYRAYGDPKNEEEARRLAREILGVHWVRDWGLDLTADDFADCRSFQGVVSRLFETWARKENKPRWGDKTPHYVMEMPAILEIFPDAKIIHIYRDGRDVALSWLRVRYEPRNVYQAARHWTKYVRAGREAGSRLPPETYMEVSYESVLMDTHATMERICRFVEEPFIESVLAPTPNPQLEGGRHRHWRVVMDSRTGDWKTVMTERDRILFESVAGDLLESLGYELRGPTRKVSALEKVYWSADHWWRYAAYRLQRRAALPHLLTYLKLLSANLRARLPFQRRSAS